MKISGLIEILNKAKDDFGDIEVFNHKREACKDGPAGASEIASVEVTEAYSSGNGSIQFTPNIVIGLDGVRRCDNPDLMVALIIN